MIPKRIFTIWLQDDQLEIPELVNRCVASQQRIEGYEHRLITLGNCFKNSAYMQQCLTSPHLKKRWCKASDYLRMYYLLNEGGIYLDADVEMLPGKDFHAFLDKKVFVGVEQFAGNGMKGSGGIAPCTQFIKNWLTSVGGKWGDPIPFIGTAVLGAEQGSPFVAEWLQRVEQNFRGDDDSNFESSMQILNDLTSRPGGDDVTVVDADYFYAYCHMQETVCITERTICLHHFMKSWT